jgi:phosphonate transport system permease protein
MSNPNSCTSAVACTAGGSSAATSHEAMAAFAQAQQALVRARRTQTATFGSLFLLAVAGSLWVSEVSVSKVVAGFPGLVAYVAGILPVVRLESVHADVAEWYWGIGRWLTLLLDTLVIAFMGTLLGATSGTGLCAHVCVRFWSRAAPWGACYCRPLAGQSRQALFRGG